MNAWPPAPAPAFRRQWLQPAVLRRALGAGMALYILSPVVAELCSGATPWFVYPIWGWVLMLMYGGGAILIREYTLRWGKGWPTIFTLGVAYGIAEEGIAVRTFFDRSAPVMQPLGDYGWAGGTNWVWDVHLSLYHAIISIAIPIFLVMLAYPARRNEPWVSSRWLKKAAVGYVGDPPLLPARLAAAGRRRPHPGQSGRDRGAGVAGSAAAGRDSSCRPARARRPLPSESPSSPSQPRSWSSGWTGARAWGCRRPALWRSC